MFANELTLSSQTEIRHHSKFCFYYYFLDKEVADRESKIDQTLHDVQIHSTQLARPIGVFSVQVTVLDLIRFLSSFHLQEWLVLPPKQCMRERVASLSSQSHFSLRLSSVSRALS